jgi:hypothetical protein
MAKTTKSDKLMPPKISFLPVPAIGTQLAWFYPHGFKHVVKPVEAE